VTVALRKLAAEKGLLYGTTISAAQITGDHPFVDLVLQQAGLVVAENDMKWQVMNRGAPDDDDYGPADTIANFAAANNLVLRGHNLLWYHRTPEWYFDLPSQREQQRAVVKHIEQLAGRYRGRVHSWDVVNEPIEPKDGRPDGLRTAVFLETLGQGYLDLAYRTAREADPGARLVVNEYDIELDAPEQEARRSALLRLLERMQRSGTPVDAVGVQAHLSAVGGPPLFRTASAAVSCRCREPRTDDPDHRARRDGRERAGRHNCSRPSGCRHLQPLSGRDPRRARGQDGGDLGLVRPA